jgi:uncharacterized protein with HEPN domain
VKDDRLYLIHITECVHRIERYTTGGREAFLAQELVQDAVVRNLQVLAESTQRLSDEMKSRQPQLDWHGISGFRTVAVHGYLGIDLEQVWLIVENDVSPLKRAVAAMLESLGPA